jgi:hypothetical protein
MGSGLRRNDTEMEARLGIERRHAEPPDGQWPPGIGGRGPETQARLRCSR